MPGKSIPISKTKIIVPHRRPELLSRPRLLESLKSLLHNKLLLLAAPAGYGKTSLLIDLAHSSEMPICWLSLDPLDRDPQRFLAYLIASLAHRFPVVGETSRQQLSRLKSIEQDAETILVMLTNELYDHVENNFLLVIDDYHLLDDVPVISDLLNRFLQLVDDNCHVLLSSRTLPALHDVTLMVAREQVAGLSHTELAFIPREVQALYAQNYHQHLSDEAAQKLIEQTGGWVTGMVLSSLPETARVSGMDMFAYLGRQVLDQQPEYVREFLIRTSLPDEFSAEFCEIVLGHLYATPQNWLAHMGLILEKNLFVLPLGDDGRWLRYHHLFREFLQARLREERPQEVHPILERMVTAYEKAGEWEKAYFTCKQLNDFEALACVIEHSGTSMLQTAMVTLEGWINSLPPAYAQTRPGLISLRGMMAAMKGNLQDANLLLDTAISIYRTSDSIIGLILALTRRANTLRLLGKYDLSLQDAEEALQLAESDSDLQFHYAEALRMKGLNLYRLGQSRLAVQELEHSLSLYTELKEMSSLAMLLNETAMARATMGDVESAKALYQDALQIWRVEKNLYAQAEVLNNLAVLHHQLGEYEFASEAYEDGLLCARTSHNQRAEALLLASLGDLYCEIEDFEAAGQAYEQAESLAAWLPGFFLSNYLVLARTNLALMQEDLAVASRLLRSFRKKLEENLSVYERGLWAWLQGRNHLLKHENKKAVSLLQQGKSCFIEDGREFESQWCMVWLIAAYEQAGQTANARSEFRELLGTRNKTTHAVLITLYQASPYLKSLQSDLQIGKSLGSLLDKSKRLGERILSIRRTLRRHTQSIQLPAPNLTIQAFGRADVTVNGHALAMADWRTKSVRDLFMYFLFKQEAVTKEQVGEALWPETTEPQALKWRFKDEIYRLRRAVGKNTIVFEDVYYRFNRALDYEYDVEAFESYLARASKTKDASKRIGWLQKAVELVHGPYLSEVDAIWAVEERERLGQIYVSALEELAQLHLNANQLHLCLSTCQLALNLDRYNEVIYRLEMRAYAALGDRASIARRYQVCKAVLEEGLGLSPSQETEVLYRDLTA
ncbi:MAG TPA: BTAD domain-containing putative transcriptional regulator [Anaerolineales bacterium]|nr:BTAD domain-containing putative transcriptional regulator [Anaerolineales bacterium]